MPMAEKNSLEMLSSVMGEQGQDALQMLARMERLKKLMGTAKSTETAVMKKEHEDIFSRSRSENMISAAIPFLDQAYRKELYVMVRLMEMRRVLQGGFLETREKQQEPPTVRRQKLLRAIQPYLEEKEQNQMETILKWMTMQELMGRAE